MLSVHPKEGVHVLHKTFQSFSLGKPHEAACDAPRFPDGGFASGQRERRKAADASAIAFLASGFGIDEEEFSAPYGSVRAVSGAVQRQPERGGVMPVFRQYAVHMGEVVLQAQDGQAGIQRIARGKVVGVQIADDCLGFDFQQPAEVFRHVLEELERLKVFQVAHMLAEESILAACKAERVLEFPACGQYAAARVAGEFQRPRNEPSCPPEEMERRRLPGEGVFRRKVSAPGPPSLKVFG